jgi:methylthioribose-1-phosphate isomerase
MDDRLYALADSIVTAYEAVEEVTLRSAPAAFVVAACALLLSAALANRPVALERPAVTAFGSFLDAWRGV